MNPISLLLIENFSKLINLFLNLMKIGVGIGGISLVYYLLKIGYLPSEFALGDGILLLMISTVVGLMCCLIFLLLWAQGKLIFDVFFIIFNFLPKYVKNNINNKIDIRNKLILPKLDKINNVFVYLVSVIVFFIIYLKEKSYGVLYYGVVCIYFYIFYILIYNVVLEYNYLSKVLGFNDARGDEYETKLLVKKEERKNLISIFLLGFFIIPIFMGGQYNVIEKIINFSMEKSNVRILKSNIYVKKEFAKLILNGKVIDSEYVEIKNIDILFKGGGKNTLIGFNQKGKYIRMELPNDSFLNVYHPSK